MNGKRTFNYVEGILKNWKGLNYKTLEDIKNNDDFKKDVQKKPLEERPKWFDEDLKAEKMTDEEYQEIYDMFKEFRED